METIDFAIPYGENRNHTYISKDVMQKALENSKGIPLIDYRKDPLGIVIGATTKDIEFDDSRNSFIGELCVWNKELPNGLKQDMEFSIVESHKESEYIVFDKMKINSISLLRDDGENNV